uniref:Photosystem II 5 kDa protein, chloroplastic n=1 Tax=Kalanchoe fedtschenkoi TaxID=63787 RepID=A0A7N0THX4_KALFE
MASATAAFSGTSTLAYNKPPPLLPPASAAKRFVAAKASMRSPEREMGMDDGSRGRRELMFAVAAATAAWSVGNIALAEDDEPKPGTPEAKKKYAPVCVTMPTARICHK